MWAKAIQDLRAHRGGGVVATAAVAVAAAVAYLVIGVVRRDPALAVGGPVIMIGYIAVLTVLRNRSESAALLSRGPSDERQAQVMLRATAFMGHLLVVVLVVGAMVSLAIGSRYIGMFCGLCAVAGVAFGGATVWYSRRG
jgi:uncharacterized membrane protein